MFINVEITALNVKKKCKIEFDEVIVGAFTQMWLYLKSAIIYYITVFEKQ